MHDLGKAINPPVVEGQINSGLPQGTGKGAYGYKYDKAIGKRVIVWSEAEVIRKIFKMAANAHSVHMVLRKNSPKKEYRVLEVSGGIL